MNNNDRHPENTESCIRNRVGQRNKAEPFLKIEATRGVNYTYMEMDIPNVHFIFPTLVVNCYILLLVPITGFCGTSLLNNYTLLFEFSFLTKDRYVVQIF